MKHTLRAAVYLVLKNNEGKYLAILRSKTGWMDGYWTLPAGRLEKGELPLRGVVREAGEEVGVNVNIEDLKLVYTMVRLQEDTDEEWLDLFFETSKFSGTPINGEPEKHEKIDWVGLNNESIKWIPNQKNALDHIEKGQNYSEMRM